MAPLNINIRTFRETLPAVAEQIARGRSFLVMKHAKPLFRVEPVQRGESATTYTLADLSAARFKGGKRASRLVDKDAYGV
ncbi:hypothetical protein A2856_02535 [Candidatus Uhrbacteria bacterium RIFCSPHIGHO2_01_FULL_63_20]|uniref:Antitoxin n=1 Tax=Candidatus Uhrbacteria bacterium RIFCSPHIGHO2_01_FULL_63_20 TaxID=1802385 RepID=A0A1F7TLX2_9BACT|nr:MAG: hypothetical protein A2856_02535 [Candidatus Uhrbacteria bacterium RIFCSPHIGHO2_01_FULL_63_20]